MTIDNTITASGGILLAVLLVLLARKQFYRSLPFFFSYQVWCLSSTAIGILAASLSMPTSDYFRYYLASTAVDALFQLALLYEVTRAIARNNRTAPPTWRLLALLLILGALLLGSLSNWPVPTRLDRLSLLMVRVQQALPILLLVCLLSVVCWSRIRSLQWPAPAMHIACGLGFYFLICLTVAVVHTHQPTGLSYHLVDEFPPGAYVGVLGYWIIIFSYTGSVIR
jgi:hypothetical protein